MRSLRLNPLIRLCIAPLALAAVSDCASSVVRVESDPAGADVALLSSSGAEKKLGLTPLSVNETEGLGAITTNDIQIKVSKPGFESQVILLPRTSMGLSATFMAKLATASSDRASTHAPETSDDLARGIAEAQNRVFKKDYEGAERQLSLLSDKHPGVATIYDLLGNVHYLRKDLGRALEAYRRSSKLQPGRVDTERLIQKILTIQGKPGEKER